MKSRSTGSSRSSAGMIRSVLAAAGEGDDAVADGVAQPAVDPVGAAPGLHPGQHAQQPPRADALHLRDGLGRGGQVPGRGGAQAQWLGLRLAVRLDVKRHCPASFVGPSLLVAVAGAVPFEASRHPGLGAAQESLQLRATGRPPARAGWPRTRGRSRCAGRRRARSPPGPCTSPRPRSAGPRWSRAVRPPPPCATECRSLTMTAAVPACIRALVEPALAEQVRGQLVAADDVDERHRGVEAVVLARRQVAPHRRQLSSGSARPRRRPSSRTSGRWCGRPA